VSNSERVVEEPNPSRPVECRSLHEWVSQHRQQPNKHGQWWAQIGDEVLARKTLWLSAVQELKAQDIPDVNVYNLAATDVFVEKAQKAISGRAKVYLWVGGIVSMSVLALMGATTIYLYLHILKDLPASIEPLAFTIMIVRMVTIGALIGGIGYFLIGIARAFLHEGTALYERRHSLRFGRLYVYLTGGKVEFEELEAAFNWNKEIYTAFKDIRADKATKSVAQLIAETGMEALKTGSTVIKARKQGKSESA
jgi:hypothetical protein